MARRGDPSQRGRIAVVLGVSQPPDVHEQCRQFHLVLCKRHTVSKWAQVSYPLGQIPSVSYTPENIRLSRKNCSDVVSHWGKGYQRLTSLPRVDAILAARADSTELKWQEVGISGDREVYLHLIWPTKRKILHQICVVNTDISCNCRYDVWTNCLQKINAPSGMNWTPCAKINSPREAITDSLESAYNRCPFSTICQYSLLTNSFDPNDILLEVSSFSICFYSCVTTYQSQNVQLINSEVVSFPRATGFFRALVSSVHWSFPVNCGFPTHWFPPDTVFLR